MKTVKQKSVINHGLINNRYVLCITIIFLVSFWITAVNLGTVKNFIGEDSGVAFNFPNTLGKIVNSMWDSFSAPGKSNITVTFSYLWNNLYLLLINLGFTPFFIKRLYYFLFFFLSGSGMFHFLNLLIQIHKPVNRQNIYLAALTGSLLYMLNHFSMEMAKLPIISYHASYVFFPFLMLSFIRNIHFKLTAAGIIIFILTFIFAINGNPSNSLTILLIMVIYYLFHYREVKFKKILYFIGASLILTLLLTAYISLPLLSIKQNPYGVVNNANNALSLTFNSEFTSFVNILRLAGSINWYNSAQFSLDNNNLVLVILGYAIPGFALFSLIIKPKRKIKLFAAVIILLSLWFAKGEHTPFGEVTRFIINNIPLLGMYRAVYMKFIFYTVFAYAMLVSYLILDIDEKWLTGTKKYLLLLPAVFICLYAYPFFIGKVTDPKFLTKIPAEYYKLEKTLQQDESDFRVLSLPPAPSGSGLLLQWPGDNQFIGPHPDMFFTGKPVIDSFWFYYHGPIKLTVADSWQGTKFEEGFDKMSQYFGALNIKYLLLHKDFADKYLINSKKDIYRIDNKLKTQVLEKQLANNKDFEIIENNPIYNLYKITDAKLVPHLFVANKITTFNQATGSYIAVPNLKNEDNPKITFIKISPTKYKIKVVNAVNSYILILLEQFDEDWKIYIDNESYLNQSNNINTPVTQNIESEINLQYLNSNVTETNSSNKFSPIHDFETNKMVQIDDKYHFLADTYANGWYIDRNYTDLKTNYELVLQYQPQVAFNYGLIIFRVVFGLSCLYLITIGFKKIYQKYENKKNN